MTEKAIIEPREFEMSESIVEIASAFCKAQSKMQNAGTNSSNESFGKAYANLQAVRDVSIPALNSEGIGVLQFPARRQGAVVLTTRLQHSSGEYIQSSCSAPLEKNDAHGLGSAITYLRRYCLAALCGVAQEDDDGNAAAQGEAKAQRAREEERSENAGPLLHLYRKAATFEDLKKANVEAGAKWKLFTAKQTKQLEEARTEAKARLVAAHKSGAAKEAEASDVPKPVSIERFLDSYAKAKTRGELTQAISSAIDVVDSLTESQKEELEQASKDARARIDGAIPQEAQEPDLAPEQEERAES